MSPYSFALLGLAFFGFSPCYSQTTNPLSLTSPVSGTGYLQWFAENLRPYQMQLSTNLQTWADYGAPVVGAGAVVGLEYHTNSAKMFYRFRKGAVRPGFNISPVAPNDDKSAGGPAPAPVPLGFSVRVGTSSVPYSVCYVNNNGNITFGASTIIYSPRPFRDRNLNVIAPFWADVDTSTPNPGGPPVIYKLVTYGTGTIGGRAAFGVNWVDVGYFDVHYDKTNSFQLVLVERSDRAPGDFDVEFNYNRILWETGDADNGASGGFGGNALYGGYPARAGISCGADSIAELPYTAVTLAQLDTEPTGLIYRSLNSPIPGRYVFEMKSGYAKGSLKVNAGTDILLRSSTTTLAGIAPVGASVHWSVFSGNGNGVVISDPNIRNPIVTVPSSQVVLLKLTATTTDNPGIEATDIVKLDRIQ